RARGTVIQARRAVSNGARRRKVFAAYVDCTVEGMASTTPDNRGEVRRHFRNVRLGSDTSASHSENGVPADGSRAIVPYFTFPESQRPRTPRAPRAAGHFRRESYKSSRRTGHSRRTSTSMAESARARNVEGSLSSLLRTRTISVVERSFVGPDISARVRAL